MAERDDERVSTDDLRKAESDPTFVVDREVASMARELLRYRESAHPQGVRAVPLVRVERWLMDVANRYGREGDDRAEQVLGAAADAVVAALTSEDAPADDRYKNPQSGDWRQERADLRVQHVADTYVATALTDPAWHPCKSDARGTTCVSLSIPWREWCVPCFARYLQRVGRFGPVPCEEQRTPAMDDPAPADVVDDIDAEYKANKPQTPNSEQDALSFKARVRSLTRPAPNIPDPPEGDQCEEEGCTNVATRCDRHPAPADEAGGGERSDGTRPDEPEDRGYVPSVEQRLDALERVIRDALPGPFDTPNEAHDPVAHQQLAEHEMALQCTADDVRELRERVEGLERRVRKQGSVTRHVASALRGDRLTPNEVESIKRTLADDSPSRVPPRRQEPSE